METQNDKLLKWIRENPEETQRITQKTILKAKIRESLNELFYLTPIKNRETINYMIDLLEEV